MGIFELSRITSLEYLVKAVKFTLVMICALTATSIAGRADEPAKPIRKTDFSPTETVHVGGTVAAVTKDAITMGPDQKAVTVYPAHDRLAAGKFQTSVSAGTSYLLTDRKVGDYIWLETVVENKQTFCIAIQITERPGGLVPPGQVVEKGLKTYHTVRNADIAFRDKGTPVPEHLKPMFPSLLPNEEIKK